MRLICCALIILEYSSSHCLFIYTEIQFLAHYVFCLVYICCMLPLCWASRYVWPVGSTGAILEGFRSKEAGIFLKFFGLRQQVLEVAESLG